jgi:hypothetical protein
VLDTAHAQLKRLLAIPPSQIQDPELWTYLRETTPMMRRAGCGPEDTHRLLLPVVLQLLLWDTVDGPTKDDLCGFLATAAG